MNLEEFAVAKFYNSKIFRFYRDNRFKISVKMACLKGHEIVLDFGCFRQELKKFLPKEQTYFAYDKNTAFGNVADWRFLKNVDTVFALAVFEHIPPAELEATIKSFKENGVKKIIAEFPWEDSPINKFLCKVFGIDFEHHLTHVSSWRKIASILNNHFECVTYRHLYWLTWISVWVLKSDS